MKRGLQPRRSSGRAAVLALDLITDFSFHDGTRVLRALTRHTPAIIRLFARAHAHRIPVIYANDNPGPWRSDSRALIAHCTKQDRRGAALVTSLAPTDKDEIILKPRHSAFYGTPLVTLLDHHAVDTLVLVGVSVESCVWMSACDAHTRGFQLIVPADAVAGASAAAVRRTLTSLKGVLGARVPASASSLRFRNRKVL